MSTISQEFKEWMDINDLKPRDICTGLGVSEQTILNWRSAGIPPRRHSFVFAFMKEWQSDRLSSLRNTASITLEVDMQTFNSWNRAALHCGKIMEDWAIDGLDCLAHQQLPASLLRVADDNRDYPSPPPDPSGCGCSGPSESAR